MSWLESAMDPSGLVDAKDLGPADQSGLRSVIRALAANRSAATIAEILAIADAVQTQPA